MLRWLHISDLHFNDNDMSTVSLREELPNFLKRNNIRCDYVFCTGDIRTANATPNDFPDEAKRYLVQLCEAVGITTDRLFIVPGNHDVNRDAAGRHDAVKRVFYHRDGYYDPKYGIINEADLQALYVGQKDFRDFLTEIYPEDRMKLYTNPAQPHFNIETPDFNILHVDSTLTYTKDQEATDLILGTKLLQNALMTLNPDKPTILLSHYPFTSLHQDEKKYVRELLYKKGVRLWLAGHEHDHMVHPMDYLNSLQTGELRMEEKTNATVLVGEYDEVTCVGYVTAYTWFAEGWAKYPILWHDGRKEDQYPFQLRLPGDNGCSREAVKAKQANSEFTDRVDVIQELLPSIAGATGKSLNEVLNNVWNTATPHVILLADGGMGKTTMLLNLCKTSGGLTLYISAEHLAAIGIGMKTYCARKLFDGDEAAFDEFCGGGYSTPTLTLLVDGLNEVNGKNERKYINEIKALNLLQGIQIVVSSRSDLTARYSMDGYNRCYLSPLSDEQTKSVFSEDEWSTVQDTFTLHKLLSNPMMVTMYKEICPIIKQFENEEALKWCIPIKNATDLLYDYYVAQIAILLQRDGMDSQKVQEAYLIVFEVLPELAYRFESSYSINKENADCRILLQQILKEHHPNVEELVPLQERLRDYDIPELKYGNVYDYLTVETRLLYRDDIVTGFPHQIYRDFLSAFWITKQTDIEKYWNQRGLPFPVMEHIRNLSGEYWNGLAARVHEVGKHRDDAFHLIGNLLDCFPHSKVGGCPDYSDLDLRALQIPDVAESAGKRISMHGAKINNVSIGKSSTRIKNYTHLCFSRENEFLAAFSDGAIFVFSLQNEEPPFVYTIDAGITQLGFAANYLIATTGGSNVGLYVFQRQKEWAYVGKIENPREAYSSIFNSSFRCAVLKDGILYFYYNNREVQFSLAECRKISNRQKQKAWKCPVDGIDVSFLSIKRRRSGNRNLGILCQIENQGLKATSMLDGGLIVTKGNEVCNVLSRGITLLKDGSISGNGKWGATLSYDVRRGNRKIQLWNLDKKIRAGDVCCPGSVDKICLSENGTFILGETDDETWVYEIEDGTVKWFDEHFISTQHGKISTYGNKVLRKNVDQDLYLYDLKTDEMTAIEQPCKNAGLACFMSDGSIAAVGNNIRKVNFKNIRTRAYSEVNSQNAAVIGISSFKNEPFIAVATQDNVISIYHIGDCGRKKIFENAGNYMMVISPENTVIACSNGQRKLKTFNYFEKMASGKKMGWWYENPYDSRDPAINGDILDISFNTENNELVAILSNGQIMFCHEKYCRFHSAIDIITNFNVDAYDFRGCICDDSVKKQIRQNGGEID